MHNLRTVTELSCTGQRVFLRADLNVPLENGIVQQDFRLQQLRPTLDLLLQRNAKIILGTHLGRPTQPDPAYSTQQLIPWFIKHGYTIRFAATLDDACTQSKEKNNTIVLLENLRFFPGEQQHDLQFARQLARLADYYVNDAFGLLHRTATSITLLAELFTPEKRAAGLLIAQECTMLNKLTHAPQHPFVIIAGGSKITDKIPLLHNLLPHADALLLCPAISSTFALLNHQEMGTSLVESGMLNACKQLLKEAEHEHVTVHMPVDYMVTTTKQPNTFVYKNELTPHDAVVSLGPTTVHTYTQQIAQAKTVFFNGLFGFLDKPETLKSVQDIFTAMAKIDGTTIVGGGDSVAALEKFNLASSMTFVSTGGGATLAYLSKQPLQALQLLMTNA